MADLNMTFEEYVGIFKSMLVKRYFWSVNDAYHFDSEKLKESFNKGLDRHYAYFKIFDVKPDLVSS
jgi:hypothetical protein